MKHLKSFFMCAMLLLIPALAYAQNKITGTVTDSKSEPIVGATVAVKGTTNATITDIDGKFALEANSGRLSITCIGFKPKVVEITGKLVFQIVLEEDSKLLDDVVIVGYGVQSRRNVTGSLSDIKSDALLRSSSTTTAGALAGKIQGISVRAKDARPGKGAVLEIRNMGNPLFVIDGIPYGGETGNDWVGSSNVSGNDVFNALILKISVS